MKPRDDIDYTTADSIEGIETGRVEEPIPDADPNSRH